MGAIDEILLQKAQAYASRHRIILGSRLGFGIHGVVLVAQRPTEPAKTAIKIHREQEPYGRERDVYERLSQLSISEVCGFHVPKLIASDESLWIIEMTIVTRPYVLDFAGAYLEHQQPDFPESIWEEWEMEKHEQFGAKWGKVQQVLASLEAFGVSMVDVSPSNIAFLDEVDD